MAEKNRIEMKVGDRARVYDHEFQRIEIIYAGMPSYNSFSIAVLHRDISTIYTYNLYFVMTQKIIEIQDLEKKFEVKMVNSRELKLEEII